MLSGEMQWEKGKVRNIKRMYEMQSKDESWDVSKIMRTEQIEKVWMLKYVEKVWECRRMRRISWSEKERFETDEKGSS
jgi:hypothetical protein